LTEPSVASSAPRNIVLFYDDYPRRRDPEYQVTREVARPLVAHLDRNGKATDWMFDSLIFYSLWLYIDKEPAQSYIDSWIDYLFDGHQVANLDTTVQQVKSSLNQPNYQMNVFLTIPVASDKIAGSEIVKNVDRMLTCWEKLKPRNLNLIGFYWGFTEDILSVPGLVGIIPPLSDYIHMKGLKMLIIPFLSTWYDHMKLHSLGFDYVVIQPNYAWREGNDLTRFERINDLIVGGHADGFEFEVPLESVKSNGGDWQLNMRNYIDQARFYNWTTCMAAYYHGSDISLMARRPGADYHEAYEMLYQYIMSTRIVATPRK